MRRALYEVVLERDREWARCLLAEAIASEERTASEDVVRAARRLRDRSLLARLRQLWWPDAPRELRRALCHAWRGIPELMDTEVIDWQLASGEYPQLMIALETIEADGRTLPAALVEQLGSQYFEVRARVRTLVAGRGTVDLAAALLPELECDVVERVRFAARCLVEWGAEDYYGDVAAALRERAHGEPMVRLVTREGCMRLEPVSARTGDGECSRSGGSRPPPSGH